MQQKIKSVKYLNRNGLAKIMKKALILWLIPLTILSSDFLVAISLLNLTNTIDFTLVIELKYLVDWLEKGRWIGSTFPGGTNLTIKTSIFRIGKGAGYSTELMENHRPVKLPIILFSNFYSFIEIKHDGRVVYKKFYGVLTLSREYFKEYYKGSLMIPTSQLLMLRTISSARFDLLDTPWKRNRLVAINSSYIISLFRNITGLRSGKIDASLYCYAIIYIIYPYELYFYSCKIPMYDFNIHYNESGLIYFRIYSHKPYMKRLSLKIVGVNFIKFMKNFFNPLLYISIALVIAYLVYPETRRFILRKWRIVVIAVGVMLIMLSFILKAGTYRVSYLLVTIRGLKVNDNFIPPVSSAYFKFKDNATVTVMFYCGICNQYPFSLNAYVTSYLKSNNRTTTLGHSIKMIRHIGDYGYYCGRKFTLRHNETKEFFIETLFKKFDPIGGVRATKHTIILNIKCHNGELHFTHKPLLVVNYGILPNYYVNLTIMMIGFLLIIVTLSVKRQSNRLLGNKM